MAATASFLIVDGASPAVAPLRAAIAALGGAVESASGHSAATQLAAGGHDALAVAAAACSPALVAAARAAGVEVWVACAEAPTAADFERALAAGCDGALSAAAPQALAGALRRLAERRSRDAADRDELLRLRQQSRDARHRLQRQNERLHDHQETFFLDLSRLMTIITNIMDGIVFVDRGGNVTLMNPVAEDLLGAKSFVAIGRPVAALQGRRELLAALAADHARMDQKREATQTVEVHHDAQDIMYIKCMTSRVLDYRGQPAGVLTVLRDVTAEHKTDQLKNQYLSIVAHELRTPLTGIKTFATMLAKGTLGPLADRQQRVCDSIREQSVRLEHQIDKLINLGNLDSSEYGQDREAFPVAELAAGLVAPFEQPARDRRIALTFDVEGADEVLSGDRSDLRRACQALVENAVKFARDGGRVAVAIERSGDGLRFRVVDDGVGIDPRYHRRIFEKFFQVEDPLTRHHGGAGLGLFVAKGIVEAHGSRIEVSSQLGQGADFSFALPVHRQGVPAHAGSSERSQGAQP